MKELLLEGKAITKSLYDCVYLQSHRLDPFVISLEA